MELDKFIGRILENVMSQGGIEKVTQIIREDMKLCDFNFDATKVECQVFDKENNHEPRVEISSDNYDGKEVIFIDYHID